MIPVNPTDMPRLTFVKDGKTTQKTHIPTNKIGWLHAITPGANASFDLIIKDGMGREKFRRSFKGERPGEYVNVPTHLGEEVDVSVENVQNADKVDIFLN